MRCSRMATGFKCTHLMHLASSNMHRLAREKQNGTGINYSLLPARDVSGVGRKRLDASRVGMFAAAKRESCRRLPERASLSAMTSPC